MISLLHIFAFTTADVASLKRINSSRIESIIKQSNITSIFWDLTIPTLPANPCSTTERSTKSRMSWLDLRRDTADAISHMTEYETKTFMFGISELPADWPASQFTLTGYRANIPLRSAALSILSTRHNEFWSIWTSIVPLAVFVYLMLADASSQPLMVTGVFIACITCQLCSAIYHVFHCVSLRATKALYNLDLAGVCCMSLGSPWLYVTAYGTSGLMIYTSALFSLMIACLVMLTRATIRNEIAACEHWIIALSSLGNYPALHRPITTLATAAAFVGYLLFYRLHFPERFLRPGAADGKIWSSHVLWHCAVFASQLCFVMSTRSTHI